MSGFLAVMARRVGESLGTDAPEPFVNVALRVPTFSLDTAEKRSAFVTSMTDAIQEAASGRLERDRIYINMLYGDGFWGVGGRAYTDDELQKELEQARQLQA